MREPFESVFDDTFGRPNDDAIFSHFRHAPLRNSGEAIRQLARDLSECIRQEYAQAETQEDKLSEIEAERRAFLANRHARDLADRQQLEGTRKRLRTMKRELGLQ